MTSNALDRLPTPVPVPTHLGQGTAVEQSRAVAEVQAAVVVAQQRPRDLQRSLAEMRESCAMQRLAERAFFRYSRGGSNVTGSTVHLARELARCFGNVTYGIVELRRDDAGGYSEMQAYAWDLEKNTRSTQTFVVPHRRDKKIDGKPGSVLLTDMRDVYEMTANQGARRLRAAIFAILPPWFVEEAEEICSRTLTEGGGKPLQQRIADAVRLFDERGITRQQIEDKLARASADWTAHDVAQLGVIYKSIQRGETTLRDEFPPQRVTAEEIAASVAPVAAQQQALPTDGSTLGRDEPAPGELP